MRYRKNKNGETRRDYSEDLFEIKNDLTQLPKSVSVEKLCIHCDHHMEYKEKYRQAVHLCTKYSKSDPVTGLYFGLIECRDLRFGTPGITEEYLCGEPMACGVDGVYWECDRVKEDDPFDLTGFDPEVQKVQS